MPFGQESSGLRLPDGASPTNSLRMDTSAERTANFQLGARIEGVLLDKDIKDTYGFDIEKAHELAEGQPRQHQSSEYMRGCFTALAHNERRFLDGACVFEDEPDLVKDRKKLAAFCMVALMLSKSKAIAVAFPDKTHAALATGTHSSPLTCNAVNIDAEVAEISAQRGKMLRVVIPKIKRSVAQAADTVMEMTSPEWRNSKEKLTGREKIAADLSRFVLRKNLSLSPMTSGKNIRTSQPSGAGRIDLRLG